MMNLNSAKKKTKQQTVLHVKCESESESEYFWYCFLRCAVRAFVVCRQTFKVIVLHALCSGICLSATSFIISISFCFPVNSLHYPTWLFHDNVSFESNSTQHSFLNSQSYFGLFFAFETECDFIWWAFPTYFRVIPWMKWKMTQNMQFTLTNISIFFKVKKGMRWTNLKCWLRSTCSMIIEES